MSEQVTQILMAFDSLPPSEQRTVTVALLGRTLDVAHTGIADDDLVLIADDLFQQLDAEEAVQK